MNFPVLPLPNKLGDPSGSYSHFNDDNMVAKFGLEDCHNSFPMLPLPNKLGDPSGSYSHFRDDNKVTKFGSDCQNSGELNLLSAYLKNDFPTKNACKKYPHTVGSSTFAQSDAIIGLINESIEHTEFDPHAFEPTPLDPDHLHSNESLSSEVATNLMNFKWNHQPIASYFLQPLSTQLDNGQIHTKIGPVHHCERRCEQL
jgi:hypothetical protein